MEKEHKCKYCGVMTTQPDEECFKAPSKTPPDLDKLHKLPSRIKYYLLDWKDQNQDIWFEKYGEMRLRDFDIIGLYNIFLFATIQDQNKHF
jgi:hypothetical protein